MAGLMSHLTYYSDSHAFLETHKDEISELHDHYEACHCPPFDVGDDPKDAFAAFGFQQITYQMAKDMGLAKDMRPVDDTDLTDGLDWLAEKGL